MVGIVIFALVAAFLGLRLYSVLGKRTGHEQPLARAIEDIVRPVVAPVVEGAPDASSPSAVEAVDPSVEGGLRAISVADRNFSAAEFIDGARSAYRMILEGYWAGREDDFAPYVSADVRSAFSEAIAARAAAGEVLDNRLINIERAVITAATLENGVAHVTVHFDADIAAVTRDTDGKVIAGSLSDAVPTHDSWTFARTLRSDDPNWVLTDTDEAE